MCQAPQLAPTGPAPTAPVPMRLPRVNTGGLKIKPISMETLWVIVRGMTSSPIEGSDGLSSKTIHTYFTGFGHILLDNYPRYMSKVNAQNKRIDGGNVYVTALFIL